MSDQEMSKHDHVLAGLMFSLQAAGMQQLGKVQDPTSGEVALNLDQARATIDVLEMLKEKCRTNTPDELLRALDGAVMDLQLNYMDELKKAKAGGGDEKAAAETEETKETEDTEPDSDDAPGNGD